MDAKDPARADVLLMPAVVHANSLRMHKCLFRRFEEIRKIQPTVFTCLADAQQDQAIFHASFCKTSPTNIT